MKRADLILLFGISLAVLLGVAWFQPVPGYMDADYYYAGGLNLFEGRGLNELFLWNYLDEPVRLPHPSHTYWMPLPSILSFMGMAILGQSDYFSARLIFLILASLISPVTAWLSFSLSKQRLSGWIAGGLAICSGYYLVYLGLVETFALTMLGSTMILIVIRAKLKPWIRYTLLGMLAGGLHLTRADGLLWLFLSFIILGMEFWGNAKGKIARILMYFLMLLGSYALVVGFWYIRNLGVFGSLFPPGNARALWLIDYDQLFSFPAVNLNFLNWWGAGITLIIKVRWDALVSQLQTLFAVQGEVFLLPLAVIGAWKLRSEKIVRVGICVWLTFFLVMTVVFPLAGSRGGFLHSGAAIQPLIWALCPIGLGRLIEIGIRKRGWKMERAMRGFGFIVVMVAAFLTMGITAVRIVGNDAGQLNWNKSWDAYQKVEQVLVKLGVEKEAIVMVNNPPGYFIAHHRTAIVIPNGDEETMAEAAKAFGAQYLVLEKDTVKDLIPLYNHPRNRPGLIYIQSVGEAHLFKIEP